MSRLASRAGRASGFSKTGEIAAHKLAAAFSKILGAYIDPYSLKIYPARGIWTHTHRDVQRFNGNFPRPDLPTLLYDFGSWHLTVSDIAKGCRMDVSDTRGIWRADNDFQIERPPSKQPSETAAPQRDGPAQPDAMERM